MKFYISQSDWVYDEEKQNAKLIKEYPCLKEYGFELEKIVTKYTRGTVQDDEGNTLEVERCKVSYKPYIIINSLEELMKFIKDVDNELVIREDYIEIYDGYRE